MASMSLASAADQIYPGADAVEHQTPSGWTFTIAPYVWLAGLDGNVGAGGITTHVDASIGDILSNFDIAVMGVAEARYEQFGIFTDLVYVRLSASGDTPLDALASGVDFTTQSLMWTAAAEYRLLDRPDASIDAVAGFRLFSLKNELDLNPPGLLGGTELSQTETLGRPHRRTEGARLAHPRILSDGLGTDRWRRVRRLDLGSDGWRRIPVHFIVFGRGRLSRGGRRL
jgi:hypothetical protein